MNLQPLRNLIAFYKSLQKTVERIADEAVMSMSDWIIEQNINQLEKGRDMNNAALKYNSRRVSPLNASGVYTKAYSQYKGKRGGQTGFVDLKQTGQFYGSLVLDRERAGVYKIIALNNEDLLNILNKNYTPDLLGLNQTNFSQLISKLDADINRRLADKIRSL